MLPHAPNAVQQTVWSPDAGTLQSGHNMTGSTEMAARENQRNGRIATIVIAGCILEQMAATADGIIEATRHND